HTRFSRDWSSDVCSSDLLALAQGASGVVIAGGLGLRIRDSLIGSGFPERFVAKGRFENLMAAIPVKLITHPQPGLFGAAAAFAQIGRAAWRGRGEHSADR